MGGKKKKGKPQPQADPGKEAQPSTSTEVKEQPEETKPKVQAVVETQEVKSKLDKGKVDKPGEESKPGGGKGKGKGDKPRDEPPAEQPKPEPVAEQTHQKKKKGKKGGEGQKAKESHPVVEERAEQEDGDGKKKKDPETAQQELGETFKQVKKKKGKQGKGGDGRASPEPQQEPAPAPQAKGAWGKGQQQQSGQVTPTGFSQDQDQASAWQEQGRGRRPQSQQQAAGGSQRLPTEQETGPSGSGRGRPGSAQEGQTWGPPAGRGAPQQQQQQQWGPQRQPGQPRQPQQGQQQRPHQQQGQQQKPYQQQQQGQQRPQQQQQGQQRPQQQQQGQQRPQQQQGQQRPQQQHQGPRQQQQGVPRQQGPPMQQQQPTGPQGVWGQPKQQQQGPPRQQGPPIQQQQPPSGPQGVWGPPRQQQQQPGAQPQQQYQQQQPQYQQGQGRGRPQGWGASGSQSPPESQPGTQTSRPPGDATQVRQRPHQQPAPDQFSMKPLQQATTEIDKEMQGAGDQAAVKKEVEIKLQRTLGSKGRKINIETNHLPLNIGQLKSAQHYDVSITPDKPKRLFRAALNKFREIYYPKRYPAFDGVKNLYSSSHLPFDQSIEGEVEVPGDDGNPNRFKVAVKWVSTVDLTVLKKYLETDDAVTLRSLNLQEPLQCIDIVLRHAVASQFIPVGRSYFSEPARQIHLGEGMGLYQGFYLSSVLGWKPYLNVDVAHKAFPLGGNVIDIILQMFNYRNPTELEDSPRDKETFRRHIKGLKVEYAIPNIHSSRRIYKVNDIDKAASQVTFKRDDGSPPISVAEYFAKEKHYRIQFPHLLTLWVGNPKREQKVLLPAELCSIVRDQVVNKKLTENQTRNMIKQAATDTGTRKRNIQNAMTRASFNTSETVKEFGFKISDDFANIEARILEPPKIQYNRFITDVKKGVWNASQFQQASAIEHWTIFNLDRYVKADQLEELSKQIQRKGQQLGMKIGQPLKPFITEQVRLREIQNRMQEFKNKQMQLIICVIPNMETAYPYVKKSAEIIVGCLTQCLKSFTVQKKLNDSTVGNILLKINAKRNGINHVLAPQLFPEVLRNKAVLIMGADVTHPSPGSDNIPSVAAVTGSFDPNAFKYRFYWRLQTPKEEIIADLENIVYEHLMYFYKYNNQSKPSHILFYRDGVSDGQFREVLNTELRAIRNGCKKVQTDGYEPPVTFLVVQKRHHTRFFPLRKNDSEDKNFNVPAGTCVDREITQFRAQDFYLVSHASIQGVAKPTKYRTLWDDVNMHEDDLEQLTYYLCHMFARCTRSVSYPAPTYYAHLAAARAKVYCENRGGSEDQLKRLQRELIIKDDIITKLPMFFV